MKLTKYTHACIVLEEQGKKLIIDPGSFTADFGDTDDVAGVVITHIHADHFDPENLEAILSANPGIKVYTTPEVVEQWSDEHAVAVAAGESLQAGPFTLEFFGQKHTEIHSLKPVADNIGVMVNNTLYYPGDSFTQPERPVAVLALPASAPWLKTSESIDYLQAVKPSTFFFRTHDGLLSKNGTAVYDAWFNTAAQAFDYTYKPLEPGESVEL